MNKRIPDAAPIQPPTPEQGRATVQLVEQLVRLERRLTWREAVAVAKVMEPAPAHERSFQ